MCTWESRYNLVIGTTFERKVSARLSSWLKKVWDSGERPGWMLPHVFDELGQYWNTNKFKAISDQDKKARGSLKGGSLHTGGAKIVGTIEQDMYVAENLDSLVQLTHELSTHISKEKVVGGTHKGRVYGLGSRNDVTQLQSGLEGIGSSLQAEALASMSDQIAKLTATLPETEQRRVAEQESMSETIQQIKELVMNLARQPTTSAPDDTDDESDEDDYVDPTP
ncbi:hypothetical protein MTR67_023158 [Solanum verrucosum]|uniref:Transposase n=1 Tax=Solanum verrucosum TaxID=315347 RepID=A0AAF0QUU9_SOLVR|nr:hypothetical protein MTR67_023158 [Solanum verrucosum]